jgi:hypothetical protein
MARGGTRSGAGRPGYRLTAEVARRIDIRRWHKGGKLRPGSSFSWQWTLDSEVTGSIGVYVRDGYIRLGYSIEGSDGQRHDASQNIKTTVTPCHYGGTRPWFECPICHNRAGVLYLRSGRFACRHCQRVSYRSQSGSAIDRVCNRFHKLEGQVLAGRQKWKRRRKFDALLNQYESASLEFDLLLAQRIAQWERPRPHMD